MRQEPSIDPVWAKGVALRDKRLDLIYKKAALFPELVGALKKIKSIIEDDMEEWSSVTKTYLPEAFWGRKDALDACRTGLAKAEALEVKV